MTKRKGGSSAREFMLADLKRSGLTPADASKLKCRSGQEESGERFYELPYFDLDGSEREFRRQRFEYDDPKYMQPEGEPPQLYFSPLLKGGWDRVARAPVDLWIGEGEKTSAAACKLGIPCIGIGGIRNWKKKGSDKLIKDFNLFPWEGLNVYICPDSDYATNGDIRIAFLALAAKLRERGANVFRVVLPTELEGKPGKVGLDDFVVAHGRDALKAVKALRVDEVTAHGSYPPLERYFNAAPEFDALDIPERDELIPGVLDAQSMMMIFGPTGIGKSWLSMELCRALATGTDFLAWPVARKCRVLLIDGEMPMQSLQHRMRLLGANDAPNFGLLSSELMYLESCPLNLHELAHQERIRRFLDGLDARKERPEVIVFDNLSSLAYGADENSNTDLDSLLQFFIALRHLGYAVVVVHHAGKSGQQRGASRREDFMNTIIKLEAVSEASSVSTFLVKFSKCRSVRPDPDSLVVEITNHGHEVTLKHRASGFREWKQWEKMLRLIRDEKPINRKDIAKLMKVKPGSLSKVVKKVRDMGYLNDRYPPVLTTEGNEYLTRLETQAEQKFA